jgi:type IV pilus assembly protein PilC
MMPQFRYRAARADGTVVSDRMDAESDLAVRTQLESQGWLVFSLEGARAGFTLPRMPWGSGRLSLREFLVFNQEFLALVKAGLPILKTIDLLAERALHPGFRAALQTVRTEVRGGHSISGAMAHCPAHFPDLYRASLQAGEQTGSLTEVLKRYIAYLKLVIGVQEKVVKALAYPAFLIVVGLAVVAFLLLYVMPTFSEIYGQTKADLPGPTKMLLAGVEILRSSWLWLLGGALALLTAISGWLRTPRGREWLDRLSLRLPIVGDVLLKNHLIRVARTLSTVLGGGIPLVSALQVTSAAMTNRMISQALVNATSRVREGVSLAAALKQEQVLPHLTLEMIEVGETTGSLEAMLQDVAEFHEGELDLRLNQLTTWIEPVLLLMMGIMVGGIVIVMYLPVFQIAGTV